MNDGCSIPGRSWLILSVLVGMNYLGDLRADTNRVQKLVTLEECIQTALLQNRDLQIERLNPEIARATLSGSYGYYDPLLAMDARTENASDSGGFDPADFSRDAIYDAESEVAKAGLTGFLPTGSATAWGVITRTVLGLGTV